MDNLKMKNYTRMFRHILILVLLVSCNSESSDDNLFKSDDSAVYNITVTKNKADTLNEFDCKLLIKSKVFSLIKTGMWECKYKPIFDKDIKNITIENSFKLVDNKTEVYIKTPNFEFEKNLQYSAYPHVIYDKKEWTLNKNIATVKEEESEVKKDIKFEYKYIEDSEFILNDSLVKCKKYKAKSTWDNNVVETDYLFSDNYGFLEFKYTFGEYEVNYRMTSNSKMKK